MVRREREHCCDDLVVEHTDYPLRYAQALASVAGISLQEPRLVLAASGPSGQLFYRIKRIMSMKKQPASYNHAFSILLFVTAITASVLIIAPAVAQNKKKEKTVSQQQQNGEYSSREMNGIHKKDAPVGDRRQHGVKNKVAAPPSPPVHSAADKAPLPPSPPDAPDVPGLPDTDIAGIVSDAMASVDWDAIGKDIDRALKAVDWKDIDRQVDDAFRQAERELRDPRQRAMIRRELKNAQMAARNAAKAQSQASGIRKDADRNRREALTEARAASVTQRNAGPQLADRIYQPANTESLVDVMHRDGLINKHGNYSIVRSGNSLIVNEQPRDEAMLEKYRRYFPGEHVIIKIEKEN